MSTDPQVSPSEETQNPSDESAPETQDAGTTQVETTPEVSAEAVKTEDAKAIERMQRRIDKRTADVYRERAEKEQLANRVAQLERMVQPDAESGAHDVRQDDLVLTKAQQLAKEIASQDRVKDSVTRVLTDGKAIAGFDAACNAVNYELPFIEGGRPSRFLSAVLEFDKPAQLLHHLGTNPDLAAELADLSPIRQIRRLDAIERELTAKAKPQTSAAPRPLDPVKPKGGDKDPSDMTDNEYAKWRRAQIAQRGR